MFNTKMFDQEGNEITLDIKLDLVGGVNVETDEDLSKFKNGDIITVVISGQPTSFGTPVYANIDLEVYQYQGQGAKIITVKEIRGAQ